MLKYLVIQLSDDAVRFCHWKSEAKDVSLMPINVLKKGIIFAMKENLLVQFVYPSYKLPQEYYHLISNIDHVNIKPLSICEEGDLGVCHLSNLANIGVGKFNGILTITCHFKELKSHIDSIKNALRIYQRVNVVIDDIADFSDNQIIEYKQLLSCLSSTIVDEIKNGRFPQINLLTDRISLQKMNNCNAGIISIALCPDGKFYICPGFYSENMGSIGDLDNGVNIKNQRLYDLRYAPICSHCDSYHCRRCVKLNRQLTLEVNTPSRQQCIISHVERNSSVKLLEDLHRLGLLGNVKLTEMDCLDPFEKRFEWED